MSQLKFQDKVALVTGASSGIGRETALALAQHGAHLALASRNVKLLNETAESVRREGRKALVMPTDVSQQDQVTKMVNETLESFGKLDILISNAGEYIRRTTTELDVAVMQRSMAVNFYSHLYAILATMPHMVARQQGHIVLVSTMDGKKGLPLDAPYVAAKSALNGLGEVMRQELRSHGIHTMLVLPGRIDTPLIENLNVPLISAKISPVPVAKAIVRGIERRKSEVYVPKYVWLMHFVNVISPVFGDWIARTFHLEGWET